MTPILAIVTVSGAEEAQKITQALVGERLAACVNAFPGVSSTYWWQGKIETGTEIVLTIKTSRELWPKLQERVKQLHSYTCPEIIAITLVELDPTYLQWWQEAIHLQAPGHKN